MQDYDVHKEDERPDTSKNDVGPREVGVIYVRGSPEVFTDAPRS